MEKIEVLPFWRVVHYKRMYWIQFFKEKPEGADGYETYTRSKEMPQRVRDYLIIPSGEKLVVVYLDYEENVAVPLFVTEKATVMGKSLKFEFNGRTYFWEPELLKCSIGTEGFEVLDTAASMRTIVCKPGTERFEQIRKNFEAFSRCGPTL